MNYAMVVSSSKQERCRSNEADFPRDWETGKGHAMRRLSSFTLPSSLTSNSTSTSLFSRFQAGLSRFVREDEGATMVEYVLLVALVAVICVGAVTLLGSNVNTKLGTAATALK